MQWSTGRIVGLIVVVAIVAGATGAFSPNVSTPLEDRPPDGATFVALGGSNAQIWPYVTPERTFDGHSSAINVVVEADAERVERHMRREAGGDWNVTDERWTTGEENVTVPQGFNTTGVPWRDSYGADRWLYVRGGPNGTDDSSVSASEEDSRGRWVKQAYQLHHGDYFGRQYHVRVFDVPVSGDDRSYTAMQAHTEHWDWFTLTHTVDSIQHAQQRVEADFMAAPFVGDVRREYFENADTYDSDGWVTVVQLDAFQSVDAPASSRSAGPLPAITALASSSLPVFVELASLALLGVAAVGSPTVARRALSALDEYGTAENRHRIGLVGSVLVVFLGVRAGGVLFERFLPSVDPWTVVYLLYPVLVVGLPLCAYAFGQHLDEADGLLYGTFGMGGAIVLDYAYLGIGVIPIELVAHRFVVTAAVGLLAAGATPITDEFEWNRTLLVAIALWCGVIVIPHLP